MLICDFKEFRFSDCGLKQSPLQPLAQYGAHKNKLYKVRENYNECQTSKQYREVTI